jgi:hypothetical protein
MSLDVNWPAFPKSINEKVWQKKKGIITVKKTGISEKIGEAEEAFKKLRPYLYARNGIDIDTREDAEKASKAMFEDAKNIIAFMKTMDEFAKHCEAKAVEFHKSKLIPKAVGDFLEEMAGDGRKLGADVKKHCDAARKEVEEVVDALSEDKNSLNAKERIEEVYNLIDDWDKHYAGEMKALEEMEKELTLLGKEVDHRLGGKGDSPIEELKEPLVRIRDGAQKVQDVMLGKKAYAALKVIKEVRGVIKKIKNDKVFFKETGDPFETRANKFLEQREKLNTVSSSIIGEAAISVSLVESGEKDEDGVIKEVAKFADIFYDNSSPNSVTKTRELIDDIAEKSKEIISGLKKEPMEKEALRALRQKADDSVVKIENSLFALMGALKTSARLTRGRFQNNPMIGTPLKKMALDVDGLKKDSKKKQDVYEQLVPLVENALG